MTDAEQCRADWLSENLTIAEPLRGESWQRVPMTAVLAPEAAEFGFAASGTQEQTSAALRAYEPEIAGLLALTLLLEGWYPDLGQDKIFRHIFAGHWGNAAPEMIAALEAAGAERQLAALREAAAQFGEPFRRDQFDRQKQLGAYSGPPNAIVQALVACGERFGSRADLVELVAAHAGSSDRLVSWCREQRRKLTPTDRLGWLVETLIQRVSGAIRHKGTAEALSPLPEPLRVIYLAAYAEAEIGNGGIHQYFTNSSGQFAPMAVEAFAALGLPDHAALIAKGVAMFPQPFPDDPGAYREAQASSAETESGERWSAWDEALAALTEDWRERPIEPAIRRYARAQGVVPK